MRGVIEASRLSHIAYHVADIDRAIAFYVGVLGFKEQTRFPIGGGIFEAVLGFPTAKVLASC